MKAETGGLQNFDKFLQRVGGFVGFKQKTHVPLLPIYENFGCGAREIDEFLSADELIEQTHRFMLNFTKMAENGRLPDTVFFWIKAHALLPTCSENCIQIIVLEKKFLK